MLPAKGGIVIGQVAFDTLQASEFARISDAVIGAGSLIKLELIKLIFSGTSRYFFKVIRVIFICIFH